MSTSPDRRRLSGGSVTREGSGLGLPPLSTFDSSRSADWFNSDEGVMPGQPGIAEPGQSYLHAFEKEESPNQQQHQQQHAEVVHPPRPPAWQSPYMHHHRQHEGGMPPPRPPMVRRAS